MLLGLQRDFNCSATVSPDCSDSQTGFLSVPAREGVSCSFWIQTLIQSSTYLSCQGIDHCKNKLHIGLLFEALQKLQPVPSMAACS